MIRNYEANNSNNTDDNVNKPFSTVIFLGPPWTYSQSAALIGPLNVVGQLRYAMGAIPKRDMERAEREAAQSTLNPVWLLVTGIPSQQPNGHEWPLPQQYRQKYFEVTGRQNRFSFITTPLGRAQFRLVLRCMSHADTAVFVLPAPKAQFDRAFSDNNHRTRNDGSGIDDAEVAAVVRDQMMAFYATTTVHSAVVVIDQMDDESVNYSEEQFKSIVSQVSRFMHRVGYDVSKIPFVPVCGVTGENIGKPATNMPWYTRKSMFAETTTNPTVAKKAAAAGNDDDDDDGAAEEQEEKKWQSHPGLCLWDVLETLPLLPDIHAAWKKRASPERPFRFTCFQAMNIIGSGALAFGRIISGCLEPQTTIRVNHGLAPWDKQTTVPLTTTKQVVCAGATLELELSGLRTWSSPPEVTGSSFFSAVKKQQQQQQHPPPPPIEEFAAHIFVLKVMGKRRHTIRPGYDVQVQCGTSSATCKLVEILESGHRSSVAHARANDDDSGIKVNPVSISVGEHALVRFRVHDWRRQPLPLEPQSRDSNSSSTNRNDAPLLSRIIITECNHLIAVGIVRMIRGPREVFYEPRHWVLLMRSESKCKGRWHELFQVFPVMVLTAKFLA